MRTIPVGAKGTYNLKVTPAHLANQFKDSMLPPVFATPMMITAMENAALNAIKAYLEPGESAVGTAVDTPISARGPRRRRKGKATGFSALPSSPRRYSVHAGANRWRIRRT